MAKATYVLVHGAWHSGELLGDVAKALRKKGCEVHTPTLKGNGAGDSKQTTLNEAIEGLCSYVTDRNLSDFVLYGHSYGGMVITGAADRLREGSIRRLVYHTAFVPHDGQSLADINPQPVNDLFQQIKQPDGGLALPFIIWRESLMNDASLSLAEKTYELLNNHPHSTMTEKISLSKSPAEMTMGKSYIECLEDYTFPKSLGGWQQFWERLGLYRHVSMPGGHEVCFTAPDLLAEKIIIAGRD